MILTPAAASDLEVFTVSRGVTMLLDKDDVHPERWNLERYEGLRQCTAPR
jgi:hypothetical protein